MRKRQKRLIQSVVIGVRRSHLDLAVVRLGSGADLPTISTRTVVWRHQAEGLTSEAGRVELATALKQLIAEEQLAGTEAMLSLSGDFCVTRVVTGNAERVRRELSDLEHRCALYLSLGIGPKAIATSIRQIDARHQHALLSVINENTLRVLLRAAQDSGLKVSHVEPSLVGSSRCAGYLGADTDAPALIINLHDQSVELGISHGGQLLLDYRPGGRLANQQVADLVVQHLARLKRYCQRYHGQSRDPLGKIYLCGDEQLLAAARKGFAQHEELSIETLDPRKAAVEWRLDDEHMGSELAAVVGACLIPLVGEDAAKGPNFMERLQLENRQHLAARCCRHFWPVAAMLLVCLTLWGIGGYERAKCNALQRQVDRLAPKMLRFKELERTSFFARAKTRHFHHIRTRSTNPAWQQVVDQVAHCMPEDVWLEDFAVVDGRRLQLNGTSFSDDGIYEFVRWLRTAPGLGRVDLEETRPAVLSLGPATRFGLYCHLAPTTDLEESLENND